MCNSLSINEEKTLNFHSINGESLKLEIKRYENAAIKFKITKVQDYRLFNKLIKGIVLLAINITCLLFQTNLATILGLSLSIPFIFSFLFETQSETLLAIPYFGFQIKTKYRFGQSTVFISWESFKDLIINELISKHKVCDYLTIITTDENKKPHQKVILIFSGTRPRLPCLEIIYQEMQALIHR